MARNRTSSDSLHSNVSSKPRSSGDSRRDSEPRSFDRKVRSPIKVAAGEDEGRKPKEKARYRTFTPILRTGLTGKYGPALRCQLRAGRASGVRPPPSFSFSDLLGLGSASCGVKAPDGDAFRRVPLKDGTVRGSAPKMRVAIACHCVGGSASQHCSCKRIAIAGHRSK
jgi:hypothetical protein